jgi:hypothetical protein
LVATPGDGMWVEFGSVVDAVRCGDSAHNRRVVDVEGPGDVPLPGNVADLVGSVCPRREPRYELRAAFTLDRLR